MEDEIEQTGAESTNDFESAFNEISSESSDSQAQSEGSASENTGTATSKNDGTVDEVPDGNGNADGTDGDSVSDDKSAKTDELEKRRSVNDHNAQRRIRKRQRQEQRIAELEERLRQYEELSDEDKQKPSVQNAYDNLQNRLVDARDDYNAEQYDAFADRICNTFGEESGNKALKLIDRYARYVNNNEPDLLKMSQRPVIGDLLLVEWCTRMDNRSQRTQYMNLTPYEKSVYLSRLYNTIYTKVTEKGNPSAKAPVHRDVPVAASGRDGVADDTTNDFNSAWNEVLNQHKKSLKGF